MSLSDVLDVAFCASLLDQIAADRWCADKCTQLLIALTLPLREAPDSIVVRAVEVDAARAQHYMQQLLVLVNRDGKRICVFVLTSLLYRGSPVVLAEGNCTLRIVSDNSAGSDFYTLRRY